MNCGLQRDGYTKYFKADSYSGFGWDEYFGDGVGVRCRIDQALEREGRLEKLMDRSNFEQGMDAHEVEYKECGERMKRITQEFEMAVRNHLLSEGGKRIGVSVYACVFVFVCVREREIIDRK